MKISKKVQIFGCGKIAIEFYRAYKNELKIECMLSNNSKELIFVPETGVEYQVFRPKINDFKEIFIIICSADYENIAEQLLLLGYIPGKDFIDYELASAILEEKKIMLLYGMCHLRGIKDCLKTSKFFTNDYEIFYYPNYIAQNAFEQLRLNYLIEHCNVFVYGIAVTVENDRKNKAIIERLYKDAKVLSLHTVYFGGYFPQKNRVYNAMNKFAVKAENYPYTPFSYEDSWLNECIDRGLSEDEVLEQLLKTTIYDKDFVLSYLENEWKRLKFQEKISDFKILDYIKDNYNKKRLFRNEAHMENSILYEYAIQLLEILGYENDILELEEPLLVCSQHCIYPSVANILNLEWDVVNEKLDLYTYNGWKKVTMKEYVHYYFEMCTDIRKWKKLNLLP